MKTKTDWCFNCSLFVSAPPVFIKMPPTFVEVLLGDSLTLSCGAHGNPRPTVVWHKDESPIEKHEKIKVRKMTHLRSYFSMKTYIKSFNSTASNCLIYHSITVLSPNFSPSLLSVNIFLLPLANFRYTMVPCLWRQPQEAFLEYINVMFPIQRATWHMRRSFRSKVSVGMKRNTVVLIS